MPLTTFSTVNLFQRTSDGTQFLGFITVTAGVPALGATFVPVPTALTPTYTFLRSLPSDRQIVYLAGIPLSTGFCNIYRYNGHTNTWTTVLSVSGALNFSCPVEIIFDETLPEHVYAIVGTWNTRAQSFHQGLTADALAGLYESTGGAAFVQVGTGTEFGYNGANINHPNTAIAACYVPTTPPKIVILHCQTSSANPLHQAVIDRSVDGGVTFASVPDLSGYVTGFMYVCLGAIQWHPEWSTPGYFFGFDVSGVGAYAIPGQTTFFNQDALFDAMAAVQIDFLSGAVGVLFFDGSGNGFAFDTNGFIHIYQLNTNGAGATEIIPETSGQGAGWRSFAVHPTEPTAVIGYQGLTGTDGSLYFTTDGAATWTLFDPLGYSIIALDFGEGSTPPPTSLVWPQTATWRDGRGETVQTRTFLTAPDAATANALGEAIVGAISDLTNARLEQALGAWTTSPIVQEPGGSGLYNSVEIKAVLSFSDSTGSVIQVEIPSPAGAVFQADGEIIDSANPGVIASVATLLASGLCGRGGFLATAFIGGRRIQSLRKRRVTVFTLTPDESGPDE